MTPTETLVAELETAERILHDKPCEVYGLEQTCAAARATLTTQSALIETLTRERDEARQQYVDANEARIDAEAALAVYDTIKAYGTPEELADMMAYVSGEATGEVAKLKASLAHCAMSLGREIALAADARQQYVDANEAKIDAEVALADLRDMTLEEAAARIEPKNERSDWTQYAHFMHEAAESIRALKSA